MFKKFLKVLQTTAILWLAILIPVVLVFSYVKTSSKTDILKYIDSYMDSEATCLSKYVGLQLNDTNKDLLRLSDSVIAKIQAQEKDINDLIKKDNNIVALSAYDSQGKAILRSDKSEDQLLDVSERTLSDLKNEDITFHLKQLDDGNVAIVYTMRRDFDDSKNKMFLTVTMKWSQYESFLDRLQAGVYPRKFYIISPDCQRYLSLNSLPKGAESNRNLIALGLHLADKIKTIKLGFSNLNLEGFSYRIFKSEIKLPAKVDGSQLFIVAVTDNEAYEIMSRGMFSSLPTVICIILFLWLLISFIVAKINGEAQNKLNLANTITDFTPSAVVVFNTETGKIEKINRSGLTLLRINKEKTGDTNVWDIFTSDKDREYIKNAAQSGISVLNYEILIQSFGGAPFWSICSASPITINSKSYIVLSALDINRRKEAEKKLANNAELLEKQIAARTADLEQKVAETQELISQLEQAKKEANTANAAKTRFLTCMSNELKTPINAILGYGEILKEEAEERKDNVTADDLSKIIGSAKHLLSLVNEILDLSAIEAGKTQLYFENVLLSSIIKEIEGVSLPLMSQNDNQLFIEAPKDPGEMYTDQTKLRQSLLNLIGNAAKFTEFGKITLRVSSIVREGIDFIEFSVIDTGCGIGAEHLENIFESFHNDSDTNAGTGLGLTITKKYVESLGGSISVESTPNVGSKFIIKVPRICTVTSSDTVEVKNQTEQDQLDDIILSTEEAIADIEGSKDAQTFSRLSDQLE
ncbi:MAG: PAS domain-containing sensor histidine kinase [Alphaproteobacteria bacterium]|nr:PAS domain-containing sensor histidine kinase [Alphaproteobacteria bacterium]